MYVIAGLTTVGTKRTALGQLHFLTWLLFSSGKDVNKHLEWKSPVDSRVWQRRDTSAPVTDQRTTTRRVARAVHVGRRWRMRAQPHTCCYELNYRFVNNVDLRARITGNEDVVNNSIHSKCNLKKYLKLKPKFSLIVGIF